MPKFQTLYFCAFLAAQMLAGWMGQIPSLPEGVDLLADAVAAHDERRREIIR